jgi:hypothetical protein
MADNQMVKIQFDFDLGNVPASAKKFADYLKTIETNSKQTQDQLNKLGDGIDRVADKMNKSSDSVKKSNQQWTNFALVIQDLPYGFRGIQNNLPALLGGIAGIAGPLYLAGSAVIAFFTAWDAGIIKFGNSVKLSTDYAKEAATAYSNESVQLDSLYRVATNANLAMSERVKAAKTLKDEYPGLLGLYSSEDIALGKADEAYKKLTITLWQYAKAKGAEAVLTEIAVKQNKLLVERANLLDKFSKNNINNFSKEADYTSDGIRLMSDYDKELDNRTRLLRKNATEYNNLEKSAGQYLKIQDANINSEAQLKSFKTKPDDKKAKAAQTLRDKELADLKAANNAAALDLLDAQSREERIVVDKYTKLLNLATKYGQNTTVLEEGQQTELANIRKKYNDIEYKRNQDSINANIAFETKIYNDSNKAFEEQQKLITETQVYFSKQRIAQVKSEADQSIKANKGNYQAQKTALEEAIAKLAIFQAFGHQGAAATLELSNAITVLQGQLYGLVDPLENFNNQLNLIIGDTLKKLAGSLGENIGKMLTQGGGISDVINGFLGILADGLIQVGELAIATGFAIEGIKKALESLNPVVAIAAGIALVALGTYVKGRLSNTSKSMSSGGSSPKAFANGGIISGPTMGLMGEYPGAKSNPEVVAPLDKLKDMLGGGGGQFVLRGSDLVLALNRSETSLNLRRGS